MSRHFGKKKEYSGKEKIKNSRKAQVKVLELILREFCLLFVFFNHFLCNILHVWVDVICYMLRPELSRNHITGTF